MNQRRRVPPVFQKGDIVFVRKDGQSAGKPDSYMRGPYRVTNVLPHSRYELKLMSGSYDETTHATAGYMTL